jgi:uncharacterized repeat protein (TIGR01451 family)
MTLHDAKLPHKSNNAFLPLRKIFVYIIAPLLLGWLVLESSHSESKNLTRPFASGSKVTGRSNSDLSMIRKPQLNLSSLKMNSLLGPSPEATSCSVIAFNWGSGTQVAFMNDDGTNPVTVASSAYNSNPSISRDGHRIVFTHSDTGGFDDDIYTINLDGSGLRRLTNNPTWDLEPSSSPDGSKIAFVSYRDGNSIFDPPEIYIMNASGTGQTRLTNNTAHDSRPAFNHDGSKIVFSSDRDGNTEIYTMNPDGTSQTRLTNTSRSEKDPVFSPDGTKIAFAAFHDNRYDIYLMNADGTGEIQLTSSADAVTQYSPSFSPDGSKIAYAFFSGSPSGTVGEIYTMNVDGTEQTNITNTPGVLETWPSWGVCPVGPPPPPEPDCTVNVNGGADHTTIQAAVDDPSCTVISVSAGTYYENIRLDRAVTIFGAGPSSTVVDGGGITKAFYIGPQPPSPELCTLGPRSYPVTLSDMKITHGTDGGPGCAVGGAILNMARLRLNNVAVVDNESFAGAVFTPEGTLTVTNSTFSGNVGTFGGAIRVDEGFNTVNQEVIIANSTFSGNSANFGAGIFAMQSVTVINSTFADNTALVDGSAIKITRGTATLKNTIIAGNTNGATQCAVSGTGAFSDGGHNLDSGSSCGFSAANESFSNAHANLGPLQNNGGLTDTMALLAGSHAINAGDNSVCAAAPVHNFDQRGITRPQNCACDIGAFEFEEAVVENPCRTPAIFWSQPGDIVYGTVLGSVQLNATASVPGNFIYNPAAGTVLNAGNSQTLSVTFTPTDTVNFKNATANVSLNVLKATPSITWDDPADIVYGTALSGAQLNATSTVAGSFIYTPPSGAVLNAGNGQSLGATFTPADTNNFFSSGANVQINVHKASTSTSLSSSVSGQVVTFTATVASTVTPTGSVEFFDGTNPLGTSPVVGGNATLATSTLGGGDHSITATYLESPNFLSSTSPALSLTEAVVTPPGSDVTVASSIGSANITANFSGIVSGGLTTIVPTDLGSVGTLPGGFELFGGGLAFDISTTATFSAPVTVCVQVPSVTNPTDFANLRVLHTVGLLDLVTANSGSNNASIRLGDGSGSFGTVVNLSAGTNSSSIATGDFNGDDNPDIAVTNQGSSNVSVRLGNGGGGFGAVTNFTVGASPRSVAVGYFNNDSNLDLAVANATPNNVSVLLGNGSGGFSTATNFAVGSSPRSVAVGDFNADGLTDLVTANNGSNNVSVLLGNGSGGFGAATNFAVGSNPRAVAVGDFNGNDNLDLAVANFGSNNVSVLLGNGLGGFGGATNFSVGTEPSSVAIANLNNDSNLDLIVGNEGSNNVSVRLGNGSGGFGAVTNFSMGTTPRSVLMADYNNDGSLDVASANSGSNNITRRLGNGTGGFGAATTFSMGTSPVSVAGGNFNRDTAVIDQTILSGPNAPNFATKTICARVTSFSPFLLAQAVPPPVDLEIEKTETNDPVILGANITYKIEVENDGPGNATGVVVTDTLPNNVTFVSASPGCIYGTGTVTCTIGNLANDQEVVRTITVQPQTTGVFTNSASVTGNETDSRLSNNTSSAQTKVLPGVLSVQLTPICVKGGVNSSATVFLAASSPINTVVTLSSSATSVAKPAVNSITIPAGQTSGSFTVKTFGVSSTKTAKIKASANSTSKEATLTVTRNGCPSG